MRDVVYTIGHSTHSIEKFIELLKASSITAVSDVRSKPYSRMNSQFNREALKEALRNENIKYVFMGKELGARSEDPTCYRNGQVQYDLLAQTDLFKEGIERVKEGAQHYNIALMCAEKEPLECHRTILVARALHAEGIEIKHILSNGKIEDHDKTIERLYTKFKIPIRDLLMSDEETTNDAYTRQAKEISYVEQTLEASPSDALADRMENRR